MNSIDLKTLEGRKIFSGFDIEIISEKRYDWSNTYDDVEKITFILDGVTYCAKENPEDGYRSSMEGLFIVDDVVKNTFVPIEVNITHVDKGDYGGENDILEFRNSKDNSLILEIGTSNIDDYYPSFICNYTPENIGEKQ